MIGVDSDVPPRSESPAAAAPSDCGRGSAEGIAPSSIVVRRDPDATPSRPATAHAIRNATDRRSGTSPRSTFQLKRRPISRSNATSAAEKRLPNTNSTGIAITRPRATGPTHAGNRLGHEAASGVGSGRRAAAVTRRIPTPAQPRTKSPSSATRTADRRVTASPPTAASDAPRSMPAAPRSRRRSVGSARTAIAMLIATAAAGSQRSSGSIRRPPGRRRNAAPSSDAARIGALTPSRLSSRSAWATSPMTAARARMRRARWRVMRAPVHGAGLAHAEDHGPGCSTVTTRQRRLLRTLAARPMARWRR